ncbi:PEP-CTERM sorting domain-containing protein [Roseateles sp.]|uniref:PEP-CTERM sorting domain-containing protein n=1 Tax=Roseateles sp. TaxID=1971397 RepID=UPI0032663E4F
MKSVQWSSGLFAIALACGPAKAAGIDAVYEWLGGTDWQVAFTLHADGTPASVSEFSVYFPEASFSTLTLQAAPATWDSLVVQPDAALASPGYLDGLLPAPAPGLTAGQSQAGWLVKFSYLGAGQPGALNFDILDSNFAVVASGQTAVVPEPAQYALLLAGALALGLWCSRRRAGEAA